MKLSLQALLQPKGTCPVFWLYQYFHAFVCLALPSNVSELLSVHSDNLTEICIIEIRSFS